MQGYEAYLSSFPQTSVDCPKRAPSPVSNNNVPRHPIDQHNVVACPRPSAFLAHRRRHDPNGWEEDHSP
jgi:hypothetical protein